MTPEISFGDTLKTARKRLAYYERALVDDAMPSTLSSLAYLASQAETKNMDRQLDRPTTFTKRGIAYTKATARKLYSEVFIKPIQAKYLRWQIFGGTRTSSDGGPAIVAPAKQRLNKFGNITRGNWKNLFTGGPKGNLVKIKRGGHTGVYRRAGKRLVLLVSLLSSAKYDKRYTFHRNIEKTVRREFEPTLRKQIARIEQKARGIR